MMPLMSKFRTCLMFLLLLAPLAPVAAAAPEEIPLETAVRALETPFRGDAAANVAIRDFQGEFSQESRLTSLDRSQRGRGRVAVHFQRTAPGRPPVASFRWDYEEPTPQQIVSDGKDLWVYVPENRQVIHSEVDAARQGQPEDPMTFLTGLGNLSRDFHIAWATPGRDAEGNPVLALTPRRPSSLLQRLQVVVDRQALAAARQGKGSIFPLRAVTIVDPVGNTTEIVFSKVRVNRGVPSGLFRFEPPPGVEVVRPPVQK
jgi:outer membrane lipoprotein carrier protein